MTDIQHSLATYVSDMLALEEHIRVPLGTQAKDDDFAGFANASGLVARVSALCDTHISALKSALDDLGGHEISGAKNVVTNVEGWFAGAIDKVRKTKVAKALRDDYTALALCSAGYSMLLATANAYGESEVAQLAQRHLQDYAQCVMEIGDAIPGVVVQDLRATGVEVDADTTQASRSQIAQAWRGGAQAQRQTRTGSVDESDLTERETARTSQ